MLPIFDEGSLLEARLCDPSEIKRGDIAVIKGGAGDYLCHRLMTKNISEGKLMLHTKGDARFRLDPPAGIDSVIGKVIFIYLGRHRINIDNMISRILGLLMSIIAPVFVRPMQRWFR